MGIGFSRQSLVHRINDAFHADKIEATAATAAKAGPDADAYQIVHTLELFGLPDDQALEAYRAGLPIPPLNNAILTAAFQYSVQNKIPLNFAISSGHIEGVQVSTSDKLISVVLTRVD